MPKPSLFVVMETIEGVSIPIAIRHSAELARARCVELAEIRLKTPHGRVVQRESGMGTTVEFAEIPVYQAFEVQDTTVDRNDLRHA